MRINVIIQLVLIATFGFGQSSSAPAGRKSHHVSMPGGERTMRGCVRQDENGSGGFVLQTARGHRVRLNSLEDLTTHVGQEVKVSGGFVDAKDPSDDSSASGSTTTPGSASSAKANPNREFKVVKLETVSTTCPAVKSNKR
jgi:Protein of unknown function (DUF5818)